MLIRLLQASLVASLLLVCLAQADEEPVVGGSGQSDEKARPDEKAASQRKAQKERPNKVKQAAERPSKSNQRGEQKNKRPDQKTRRSAEEEREQAALAFVREHHPDLVDLLKRLKSTKEKEYQQAINELSRDCKRIETLRDRDPDRYKLELRAWQLDSGIRLLTAKLSLEDRPELQEDLKAALAERAEVRLAQRKLERERLTARLEKLDAEIEGFAGQREADLKRNFDRLLRQAEKARGRAAPQENKTKDNKPRENE